MTFHFLVGVFQGVQRPVRYSLSAEMFPLKGRGAIMMFTRIGWPIGALCATLIQRFVHPLNVPQLMPFGQGWRLCLMLSCLPLYIVLLLGLIGVPESPRYYIAMGKYEKAFSVLSCIRSCACAKDKHQLIEEETRDLQALLCKNGDQQQRQGHSSGVADANHGSRQRKSLGTDMHADESPSAAVRERATHSSRCERFFPRALWTVPRLSYTRCGCI